MVDKEIVRYLQEGKQRGFSFDLLKQKLLERGFKAEVVNESLAFVKEFDKKGATSKFDRRDEPLRLKWMKISGIAGIILFSLGLVFAILLNIYEIPIGFKNFMSPNSLDLPKAGGFGMPLFIVILIFLVVILGTYFLYLYGFTRLAKYLKLRVMNISSWVVIFSGINVGLIFVFFIIYSYRIIENSPSIFEIPDILLNFVLIFKIGLVVLLFTSIIGFVFSISLILAREIKFILVSGILNVILFIYGFIASSFYIVILFSSTLNSDNSFIWGIINMISNEIAFVGISLIMLFGILFGSLGLLKSSQIFE